MSASETHLDVSPVVKAVTVKWGIEDAFRRFTREIHTWWPTETHSVGRDKTETVVFEGRVGGRVYERQTSGETSEWGRVLGWDPPNGVVITWYPGRDPEGGQEVDVRFTTVEEGTRVDLVHRGWETLGERAQEVRDNYDGGWDPVLAGYAAS